MGEKGTYQLHVYCDSPDCEFLPQGPVEGEPFMQIFRSKDVENARRSALIGGWKRMEVFGHITGNYPAWMCPECVKKAES